MNKGICLYFGYNVGVKKRAKMIAEAGFNSVITSADPSFAWQNGKISYQVKLLKKEGLRHSSLHMRYCKDELPHFFKDDNIGRKLEKNLIKDIKIAKKFGFKCVVVHLEGKISFVGIERFKRILKVCEKTKIPLALENLRDLRPLEYFLDTFKSDYVKFCYDSGHHNAYNKKVRLLSKYGDRLICVHLHDNDGSIDAHDFNEFGSIDWQQLAKELAKTNLKSLDYELMPKETHGFTAEEALMKCIRQANNFEKMIRIERRKLRERKKRFAERGRSAQGIVQKGNGKLSKFVAIQGGL